MLSLFNRKWSDVPTVWIDTETTGAQPGVDKAVQVGLVRFEQGVPVAEFGSLICPGDLLISQEATATHGITNEQVENAPYIEEVFGLAAVRELIDGAQPAAYNAGFDRAMVPPFCEDAMWPWLDALSLVRQVDRFVKGTGRHKLDVSCIRHGITLSNAHNALADAMAAGHLFYRLAPEHYGPKATLGEVLRKQRLAEAEDWYRFFDWLSKQPPRESTQP